MTEGNIASWNVKEGQSFSAGDVLLEVETDKATMDVEAQDDGIMMKIMSGDGSKGVQVGTRIAVTAEAGDDISTLEIPADEQSQPSGGQVAKEESSAPAPQQSKSTKSEAPKPTGTGTYEHKHPLLPSVGHLVKQHGLAESDIGKIKGTGPNGRLLKGDVLAYIGTINAETPGAVSSRFDKLSHLDLSNIKVAAKKAPAPKQEKAAPQEPVIENLEINVPVSLAKVVEVQRKVQDTLGVFLPLSTFITRAAELANSELPASRREPTVDELFDQVLGLDKVRKSSRGVYFPQISALPPASAFAPLPKQKSADIIDILSSSGPGSSSGPAPPIPVVPGLSNNNNLFTLVVAKAEEERAQTFLERCKVILEQEPGRLVL